MSTALLWIGLTFWKERSRVTEVEARLTSERARLEQAHEEGMAAAETAENERAVTDEATHLARLRDQGLVSGATARERHAGEWRRRLAHDPAQAAENGAGTGFSFCIDNYRFANYPAGGTANTSGMKVRYNNVDLAGIQIPSWGYGAFIPVTITVTPTGGCTIMVNNTNAFTLALPGFAPALGRFGIFARTGGAFESHAIDDLSIAFVTADTAAGGRVSESGGTVTYIPPVTCGLDPFY